MFDDFLNASTLVGVSALMAAVIVTATLETTTPVQQPVAKAPAAKAVAAAKAAQPSPAMTVYELPRVVVTGNRSRDGDVLATSEASPVTPRLEPVR